MARPPRIPGKPATAMLHVRLTPDGLQELDRLRDTTSRSEFVRTLLADASRKARTTVRT